VLAASGVYSALAAFVLFLHALFIVWVVFGAFVMHSRPGPCPLTLLENWLEAKATVQPYQGGFLLHYLDKLVYPDISATVLTVAGVLVCVLNLTLYGRQMWIARSR
jgi:hypothetical protein